ncbi:MAG: glycosyltransferase family 4 protein [Undibacterium sp.]|nr:glycosyltransferase family 4 protein [Opitutaceae bacterium]
MPPLRGGAVEKVWFALGQEFARRGHEVTHYSRLCDGLPETEIIGGVRHVRVPGADTPSSLVRLKWRDLLYTRRVAKKLTRVAVVVTNTFWAPLVFSPRRHGPIWVHVQRYPKGQMLFYRRAARLQTVSRVIADAITRQAPSLAARVSVIPNPLPPLVAPATSVGRDPNLVLFVGRLHPEKGIELLLQAAVLARQTAPALRFCIVGPSETRFGGGGAGFRRRLDALAVPLGTAVEFTGPVFDEARLAAHYAHASVFAYPSLAARGEASPVAPLEALARGCPVVTSDLACFDDTIGTGPFAHRFDHTAPDAAARLAAVLVRVTTDRQAWASASVAAEARAHEFSIRRIAREYLAGFATLPS